MMLEPGGACYSLQLSKPRWVLSVSARCPTSLWARESTVLRSYPDMLLSSEGRMSVRLLLPWGGVLAAAFEVSPFFDR